MPQRKIEHPTKRNVHAVYDFVFGLRPSTVSEGPWPAWPEEFRIDET